MKKLLVIVATILLLAAACSTGDGDGITIGTEDAGNASSTGGDSATSGDGGGEWCARALVFDDSINVLNTDSPPSPEVIEAAYEEISSQFESIKQGAPPEIADAVDKSVEGFELIFEAFRAADYNFLNVDLATLELLDDPLYTEASDTVEAYLRDVCGLVDPDVPAAGDEGSTDGAPADDSSGDELQLPTDGTVADVIVQSLVSAGFTQGEAECLAQALGGDLLSNADDPNMIFQAFDECSIDLERLSQLEN